MKKLLKNKRLISGLVALMLGAAILVMSLSLAWFYDSDTDESSGVITIGSLKIKAALVDDVLQDRRNTYPKTTEYYGKVAKIWKEGSIDAMVQVKLEALGCNPQSMDLPVIFDVLDKGYKSPGSKGYAKTWPLGVWYFPDNSYACIWYEGGDGNLYVEIQGGDDTHNFPPDILADQQGGDTSLYPNYDLHIAYNIEFPESARDADRWFDNADYNLLVEPYTFKVQISADGVQAFPELAREEYFATTFDILNDDYVLSIEYDALTGLYTATSIGAVDPGWDQINPEGDGMGVVPFSASSGPDLVKIAKLVQSLQDGTSKTALAAKYGITIG